MFRLANPLKARLLSPSRRTLSHNLEDHFDFAEAMTFMQGPLANYAFVWLFIGAGMMYPILPTFNANYYYNGRMFPKNNRDMLTEDSW